MKTTELVSICISTYGIFQPWYLSRGKNYLTSYFFYWKWIRELFFLLEKYFLIVFSNGKVFFSGLSYENFLFK